MSIPSLLASLKKDLRSQTGAILPIAAVALGTVLMMTALAVDVGYIVSTRGELEGAADSAALAAIGKAYTEAATAEQIARNFASQHMAGGQNVLLSRVELGRFDFPNYFANGNAGAAFLPGQTPITAARVEAARDTNVATGPLDLFFARVLDVQNVNVSRQAIAVHNPYVSGAPARTHVIPFTMHRSLVEDAGGNIRVGELVYARLRPEAPAPPLPAGGFGWLSPLWDQTHAPDVPGLRDAIQNGLPVDARIPYPPGYADVYGTPGTKGGSLNDAFLALTRPNGDETQGAYGGHALRTQTNCSDRNLTNFPTCTGATQSLSCSGTGCSCSPLVRLMEPENCPSSCASYACTGGDSYNHVTAIANSAVVYIPIYSESFDQGVNALFRINYFIAARIEEVILTGPLAYRGIKVRILGTQTYPPEVTSDLFLDPNAPPNPTLQKLQLIA